MYSRKEMIVVPFWRNSVVNLVWYIVPTQPDLHKQTYNVIYSYTHTHAHWIIHNTGSHFKVKTIENLLKL